MIKEKQINCNSYQINYIDEGEGEAIIFLHNGGGFWQIWERQIQYFRPNYRVVAFDFPNYGESEVAREPVSILFYYQILRTLLHALHLPKVILVGNCIGASVALFYKQEHPDEVQKLILFHICPGERLFVHPIVSRFMAFVAAHNWAKRGFTVLFTPIVRLSLMRRYILWRIFGSHTDQNNPIYQRYAAKCQERRPPPIRLNLLFALHSYTLKNWLKPDTNIEKPLLIWGEKNHVTPLQTHGTYHRQLLGIERIVAISAGGHLCMHSHDKTVNEAMGAYISY